MKPKSSDASELMGLMNALHSGVHRQVRTFLQPFDLTIPQYRTLVHIARQAGGEPVTVGSLSEHLRVACSTASGIVDRLARDGWVTRCRKDADRRRVRIQVTDKARRVLDREIVTLESYWNMVLDAISASQRRTILAGLTRLRDIAEDVSLQNGGTSPERDDEDRRRAEKLRTLWREEIGASGRYYVGSIMAEGRPETEARLRQMARDKIDHAVEMRKLMGRSQDITRYAERLVRHSQRRRSMIADILSDRATSKEMSAFLRRVDSDEERHEAWLKKIKKVSE